MGGGGGGGGGGGEKEEEEEKSIKILDNEMLVNVVKIILNGIHFVLYVLITKLLQLWRVKGATLELIYKYKIKKIKNNKN